MALTVQTLRPNSTPQVGTVATVTGGGGVAHVALSDNSDASYVQLTARCRTDAQVLRVGFPTPTPPAGSKVLSVGLRLRVFTVAAAAPQPVLNHWFRCFEGLPLIYGEVVPPKKRFFSSLCPTDPVGGTWSTVSLGAQITAPSGNAWDVTTNLANFTYDIGRGDDLGGNHRISEVYLDVTYQQISTVTVTGPSGTVASTRPTITWTYSSPDSQPQQSYQVLIYTAAQVGLLGFAPFVTTPIQDSGLTLGEDLQWTLDDDLPDGTYYAYVRANSKWSGVGDFPTAIASTSWTRTVSVGGGGQPAAAQPPNAVLSSATFDAANNRVALTMVPSSSSPTTAAYTVQVSRDGGPWGTIPSLTLIPAAGMTPVTAYDYVAPISKVSQYRVLSYSQSSGLYVAAAGTSGTLSVTPTSPYWWAKDPTNWLLNTILPVIVDGKGEGKPNKVNRRGVSGTFEPLSGNGTVPPIVVGGPYYGESGTLELRFHLNQAADYWPAYDALEQSGHTVLLQKPFGDQVWVQLSAGANSQDTQLTYDVVPGRPDLVQWRHIIVSYTLVGAPDFY